MAYLEHTSAGLPRFPEDYTVVDLETTGLSPARDEIIELSALRVRGSVIVDSYSVLVRPRRRISRFITNLTGITNDDVADAPEIAEALPPFLAFVGADIVVGHNVSFDMGFLRENAAACMGVTLSNQTVDTVRLSRSLLPQLPSHKLGSVAAALGVVPSGAHRGLVDCETTFAVLQGLRALAQSARPAAEALRRGPWPENVKLSELTPEPGKARPDSPLFGCVCVFTGTLERFSRREAMQRVVNIGGICAGSVTAKTRFLIVGTEPDGVKSRKQQKAEALLAQGQEITFLTEAAFSALVED